MDNDYVLAYENELYNDEEHSNKSEQESDIEDILYGQAHYAMKLETENNVIIDENSNTSSVDKSFPELIVADSESYILGAESISKKKKNLNAVVGEDCDMWDIDDADLHIKPGQRKPVIRYYVGETLPNINCYNCNKKGHMAKDCEEVKRVPTCYLCGQLGHMRRDCPNDLCYNCMDMGHIGKDCPKPRCKSYYAKHCQRCDFHGHYEKCCTEIWRQYHATVKDGVLTRPDQPYLENRRRFCYNCASRKHFGEDCNEERYSKRPVFSQFIVNYHKCKSTQGSVKKKKKKDDLTVGIDVENEKNDRYKKKKNTERNLDEKLRKEGKEKKKSNEEESRASKKKSSKEGSSNTKGVELSAKNKGRKKKTGVDVDQENNEIDDLIVVDEWVEKEVDEVKKSKKKKKSEKHEKEVTFNPIQKVIKVIQEKTGLKRKRKNDWSVSDDLHINDEVDGVKKKRKIGEIKTKRSKIDEIEKEKKSNSAFVMNDDSISISTSTMEGRTTGESNGRESREKRNNPGKRTSQSENFNESGKQKRNSFVDNDDFIPISSMKTHKSSGLSEKLENRIERVKLTESSIKSINNAFVNNIDVVSKLHSPKRRKEGGGNKKENRKEMKKIEQTRKPDKKFREYDLDYVTLTNLQQILSDSDNEECDVRTMLESARSSPDININGFENDVDYCSDDVKELEPNDARHLIGSKSGLVVIPDFTRYDPASVNQDDLSLYGLINPTYRPQQEVKHAYKARATSTVFQREQIISNGGDVRKFVHYYDTKAKCWTSRVQPRAANTVGNKRLRNWKRKGKGQRSQENREQQQQQDIRRVSMKKTNKKVKNIIFKKANKKPENTRHPEKVKINRGFNLRHIIDSL